MIVASSVKPYVTSPGRWLFPRGSVSPPASAGAVRLYYYTLSAPGLSSRLGVDWVGITFGVLDPWEVIK